MPIRLPKAHHVQEVRLCRWVEYSTLRFSSRDTRARSPLAPVRQLRLISIRIDDDQYGLPSSQGLRFIREWPKPRTLRPCVKSIVERRHDGPGRYARFRSQRGMLPVRGWIPLCAEGFGPWYTKLANSSEDQQIWVTGTCSSSRDGQPSTLVAGLAVLLP